MAMLSSTLRGRVLKFHSPAVDPNTLLVVSMDGREALSRPYRFALELISKRTDLDSSALLADPASIGIKQAVTLKGSNKLGVQTLRVRGMLSSFEQSGRAMAWIFYRAVLVPRLWKLSLTVRSRVFQGKTVPQIVEEVLLDHRLKTPDDFEFAAKGREYPEREYVVQYQESDLNFVSRLLEHEGIFFFFQQGDEVEKIVFADGTDAYEPVLGSAEIPYRPVDVLAGKGADQGEWFQQEVVRRLDYRHQLLPAEVVLRDYNYRTPSTDLQSGAPVVEGGVGTVYEYGDHYKDPTEGGKLAEVRAQELACREKIFAGQGDCRSFRAGATYTLVEHYRSDFNREYLITEVRHRAKQSFALSGGGAQASSYENEFVSIPADAVFRPERITRKPRIPGLLNATVDAAGDGEYAEIDDQGRYKVKLALDLSDKKDGNASRYVRMAQPYAGPGYGFHFPAHKKTEVLLAHVGGDPDRPVIASTIHHPEVPSPVVSENQTQAILRTGSNNQLIIKNGWEIKYTKPPDSGSFCARDRTPPEICIDPAMKDDPMALASVLSHEVGHADFTPNFVTDPDPRKHVEQNKMEQLKDEGAAVQNNVAAKDEVKKNCGKDLDVNGDDANGTLEKICKGPGTDDQKREAIGKEFAKLNPSTDPTSTYDRYYAKGWEKHVTDNPQSWNPLDAPWEFHFPD